ncbi:MAG: hypothetical protein AB7F38_01305 [Piscinibacter sp.]
MWVIFARAPPPDVQVWPGRRVLAFIDAVAWPAAWAAWLLGLSMQFGLAGQFALAWCGVAAARRAFRAVLLNHRYHFTTWRWGRWLVVMLLFGYSLKLAVYLTSWP